MSTGLIEISDEDIDADLEQFLLPQLLKLVDGREAGHCMRVDDLPPGLARRLTRRLRAAAAGAQVHVLAAPNGSATDTDVSSTKLVELRNPDTEGQPRPPLLVFVPPGLRASAEDSFGVATFEEVDLGDVYHQLVARRLDELPGELGTAIGEVFGELDRGGWPHASDLARARYLITLQRNDFDHQAAGGALFELGLVPDFELLADPRQAGVRIARNSDSVRTLMGAALPGRQRVIALRLTEAEFQARLAAFAADVDMSQSPRHWTRRIVVERRNWPLEFSRWPLRGQLSYTEVAIEVGDLELPVAGELAQDANHQVLGRISGQQYLPVGDGGLNQLAVPFRVAPDPRQVAGLAKFVVRIVAENGERTEVMTTVSPSKTGRTSLRATLRRLRNTAWDEGWYLVEVTAVDADGVALPRPDSSAAAPAAARRPFQSDRFYVLPDGDVDSPPDVRATKYVGLSHALRDIQFGALAAGRDPDRVRCRGVQWKPATPRATASTVAARFGAEGLVEIPVPSRLAELEQRILADADQPTSWQLSVQAGHDTIVEAGSLPWSAPYLDRELLDTFRGARSRLFAALAGPDEPRMVIEAADLSAVYEQIRDYAQAYQDLLTAQLHWLEQLDAHGRDADQRSALRDLAGLLRIDTANVVVTDYRGQRHDAVLVCPTHPLRLLWLAGWSRLAGQWLEDLRGADAVGVAEARAVLFGATAGVRRAAELQPLGFPLVVPKADGRLTIAAHDLNPYWGVCISSDTADPQNLLTILESSLSLSGTPAGEATWLRHELVDRLARYLRLHPYVRVLVINALNAGRGARLATILAELAGKPEFPDLNFDLRLFVVDPEATGTAEALSELLRTGDLEGVDLPATLPDLGNRTTVAVRTVADFLEPDSDHPAHVTLLFDAFSGEEFDTTPAIHGAARVPVHGLVQRMEVTYSEDEQVVAWHKQPLHGRANPMAGAEEISDLLASLPVAISSAAASVAVGEHAGQQSPRIVLSLTVRDQLLLHEAHHSSDWVITVDRTLGAEYFDNPRGLRRPDYVLDYAPEPATGVGRHILVSSRSLDELSAMLRPAIRQHGLQFADRHLATFFDQLRLLSGRLAFKLAAVTPTQRTEVLGLALARLYLDYQGALAGQILVPLDSHPELYREARARAVAGDGAALHRSDLALFDVDADRRTVTCRLVEVKCHTHVGIGDYQQLQQTITKQLDRSADVLAEQFDPVRHSPDRPDRSVKNLELSGMLRHYLDRAVRHGVLAEGRAEQAGWLLDRLDEDEGYRLEFTRTGLIFDLSGSGTDTEDEAGVRFHRIGRDLIEELLSSVPTEAPHATFSLADAELSLPRFGDASFKAPARPQPHDGEATPVAEPPTPPPAETDIAEDAAPAPAGDRVPAGATASGDPSPPGEDHPREEAAATGRTDAPAARRSAAPEPRPAVKSNVPTMFVGTTAPSAQYGVLGKAAGRKVALDLNETHTVSLFGVQGGGKSYTLGSMVEMASLPAPGVNELPFPLATIIFHYSSTQDYAPEFTSMVRPNTHESQVALLREQYGVEPRALDDVLLLVPEDQLDTRREQYPGLYVHPLKFGSAELRAEHWRFLMGAVGNQSTYIRQLTQIMRAHRNDLTIDAIRHGIEDSRLADHLKQLANQRLDLAASYIDDSIRIGKLVRPGRLIIVDLRDGYIEKDDALGIFVVLMQIFAEVKGDDRRFNKLVVFDEAHKYIDSPDLVSGLVESVREMRHKGMSVLVASQDPPSVPVALIELSDHVILHKFTSPGWLKHLQKANTALSALTPSKMSELRPGEAYIWAGKATDAAFTTGAVRVQLRPRLTQHGGGTKTALDG